MAKVVLNDFQRGKLPYFVKPNVSAMHLDIVFKTDRLKKKICIATCNASSYNARKRAEVLCDWS